MEYNDYIKAIEDIESKIAKATSVKELDDLQDQLLDLHYKVNSDVVQSGERQSDILEGNGS